MRNKYIYEFIGDYHVRIRDPYNPGDSTTWPIPAGKMCSSIKERINNAVYHKSDLTLNYSELMAISSLVSAYINLVIGDCPADRRSTLRKAFNQAFSNDES